MNSTQRSDNCLVVYRDTPERIIQEDMLGCFSQLAIWPRYVICETPQESDPALELNVRDELIALNPPDRSVWLRDDSGKFIMVADIVSRGGKDLLADFYQSEILKKISAIVSVLQMLGVKSYQVQASEEVTREDNEVREGSGDLTGKVGVADVHLTAKGSQANKGSFEQKINRGFVFSQSRCKRVDEVDRREIDSAMLKMGLSGVHLLGTLLRAVEDGDEMWQGLSVEESIPADVCSRTSSKIEAAMQVALNMAGRNADISANYSGLMEKSVRMLQSLSVKVSNI